MLLGSVPGSATVLVPALDPVPDIKWSWPWSWSQSRNKAGPGTWSRSCHISGPSRGPGQHFWSLHTMPSADLGRTLRWLEPASPGQDLTPCLSRRDSVLTRAWLTVHAYGVGGWCSRWVLPLPAITTLRLLFVSVHYGPLLQRSVPGGGAGAHTQPVEPYCSEGRLKLKWLCVIFMLRKARKELFTE